MRRKAHFVLAAAALATLAVSHKGYSQTISLSGTTPTAAENFDTIGTSATATLPIGWKTDSGATSTTSYSAAANATGRNGFVTGTGAISSASSGGTYNLSSGAVDGTDRAVGWITSGSFVGPRNLMAEFTNNTGTGIVDLSLQYDIEEYRAGNHDFGINLYYSFDGINWTSPTNATSTTNFNTAGGAGTSLNTDISNGVSSTGTSLTFTTPPTTTVGLTIPGVNVPAGANVFLRWQYTSSSASYSSAIGLGIDNFSLHATTGTLAGDALTVVWNPSGSATGGTEGSGTWDSTTPTQWYGIFNKTNGAWSDSAPDNAVFGVGGGAGTSTVTLGSDHTAGALTFSAGSNTYTITGGTITLLGNSAQALVSPGTSITAQKNATIASNVVLNNPGGGNIVSASAGATLLLSGVVSGGALTKIGDGTLVLGNTGNTMSRVILSGGTLMFDNPAELGATGPNYTLGTVVNTAGITYTQNVTASGPITMDTTAGDVTFGGRLIGNGAITKIGGNNLIFNQDQSGIGFNVFTGAININGGAVRIQSTTSGNGFFDVPTGDATITINSGGVLAFDNIQSGEGQAFGPDTLPVLGNGGTLLGTGTASFYQGDNSSFGGDTANPALKITNGTAASPNSMTIATTAATDTLTIGGWIGQTTAGSSGTSASINVNGPGRIILLSGLGEKQSTSVFGGQWNLNGGILQLGPVRPNSYFDLTNGAAFNLSDPLLALGYFGGKFASGSPVTINSGATLAIGIDIANPNNVATAQKESSTGGTVTTSIVPYLQAPVTLAGGSVASTYFKTDPNSGNPTGTPVEGQIGGGFTVANAAGNRVLTYDPVAANGIGANSIDLVASGGTTWNGNLTVDPGTTTGGVFVINRDYSAILATGGAAPVSVTAGSTITVSSGSILKLTGSAALSDGTHRVNVVNNSSASGMGLDVEANANGSTQIIGNLTGNGITVVGSGATLTADRVAQQSVILSGTLAVAHSATNDKANVIANVNITGGKLDLNNTDLIVTTPSAANIHSLLAAGYSGGAWNGAGGIDSTDAGANFATQHVSLGYAIPGHIGATSFDGVSLTGADANDVIVKYTYNGDGNLDGKVDLGNDFNLFLAGYLNNALLNGSDNWSLGDYNYDGVVDNSDFGMFVDGIKSQGATPLGDLDAVISSSPLLSNAQKSALLAAVPEPSSLTALALVSAGFMSKRNRRK